MDQQTYNAYVKILHDELLPAMGCTEPITIAYAAATARELLGELPDRVVVEASGNIIKNVKSVIVPNTNGLKGIEAAVAAGLVAGQKDKLLEVISEVSPAQKEEIGALAAKPIFDIQLSSSGLVFDFLLTIYKDDRYAKIRIVNTHTNIVLLECCGQVLVSQPVDEASCIGTVSPEKELLNVQDIVEFADTVNLDDIRDVIQRQIRCNSAIAEEGLRGNYGGNVGSVILKDTAPDDLCARAKAKAAAASDARMSGCELPVVINSGSGNQGITVSVPVIEYARAMDISEDRLYRALCVSNLVAIHQKTGIGTLSAYCGAVSAGSAAGAGIAYLCGGGQYEVAHTIVNSLAITSGIVCDGAKPSCAGKIAVSVESGILGYQMICQQQQFRRGDGIIKAGVEATIKSVGTLGRDGMRETDREILKIMLEK